jgi:hypothetical protein
MMTAPEDFIAINPELAERAWQFVMEEFTIRVSRPTGS